MNPLSSNHIKFTTFAGFNGPYKTVMISDLYTIVFDVSKMRTILHETRESFRRVQVDMLGQPLVTEDYKNRHNIAYLSLQDGKLVDDFILRYNNKIIWVLAAPTVREPQQMFDLMGKQVANGTTTVEVYERHVYLPQAADPKHAGVAANMLLDLYFGEVPTL